MPLVDFELHCEEKAIPLEVRSFLHEAGRRIARFQRDSRIPGFVASEFGMAYRILRALVESDLASGRLFCEWGSGFGVVAGLAAMLELDAFGIEIEQELVDAAQRLADDFGLPVEFVRGSFIPAESTAELEAGEGFSWLNTDRDRGTEELGLGPADFDLIFAYPWPDEEKLVEKLFEQHARAGSILVTYHGGSDFRLRRKTRKAARRC